MYNKIVLAGNLTRDIEVRYTQGGSAVGNTAIATTRKFKSATGEQKEEVLFVDITFFGRLAEIANQYLHKGSKVLVDGRLKLDQWSAQDGSKRSKHSVTVESLQMLDSKPTTQNTNSDHDQQTPSGTGYSQPYPQQAQPQSQTATPQNNPPVVDIAEDEIPF